VLGCTHADDRAPIARDPAKSTPSDASVSVPDSSPELFPITEDSARMLIGSSSLINPPTSIDPNNRVRLIAPPPAGCTASDASCGWKFEYGSNPITEPPPAQITNVKGTCFVHAHSGVGTCTPTGQKPVPIGTALR
jgi:hypothetical protein